MPDCTGRRPRIQSRTVRPTPTTGTQHQGAYVTGGEEFNRDTNYIEDRITRDGAPGRQRRARLAGGGRPLPADRGARLPVGQPHRHRAPAARASRTPSRSASPAPPTTPAPGPSTWIPDGKDPVLGIERLQEAYFRRFPDYPAASPCRRSWTSPAARSSPTTSRRSRWTSPRSGPSSTAPAPRSCTRSTCAEEIDAVNKRVFTEVNNGVYRCGFAGSQEAYDAAYDRLWTALDWLEERLAGQRYLVGDTITEADVRLFTTLARFDAVYHGHFKCNRQQAQRDAGRCGPTRGTCSRRPASATPSTSSRSSSTTTSSTRTSTPPAIVPAGPDLSGWLTAHGRESLGGRPFGDGTPPGPVRAGEEVAAGHGAAQPTPARPEG